LGIGHIRIKTHDYVRHGTLTPACAGAGSYLPRSIISTASFSTHLAASHRLQEWLAFLKLIDQ
jgi:hypothetical protein